MRQKNNDYFIVSKHIQLIHHGPYHGPYTPRYLEMRLVLIHQPEKVYFLILKDFGTTFSVFGSLVLISMKLTSKCTSTVPI